MANSKIEIEFTEVPEIGQNISFLEELYAINFVETFKNVRTGANQTVLPHYDLVNEIYEGFVSENYKSALNLDANATGLFTITWTNGDPDLGIGTVLITANYPNAIFSEVSNTTTANVTITNEAIIPNFTINEVNFTQSVGNEENYCKVNVTTNHLAVDILEPVSFLGNTDNPYLFDWIRNQTFNLKLKDANGTIINQSVTTPSYLSSSNFNILINNSPNGATVVITEVAETHGLELQYSLNGTDWQTSNVFSSLDIGTFDLYIKDQLGYQIQIQFEVVESGVYTPFFYISKSNSIRFANRITWGDSANYKNDENTLSYEVDVEVPYKEILQYHSANVVTTQFKSNYETNIATIVKSDNSEVDVPVTKMTNNIGIKDKRDAIKHNLNNGKTGIYFQSGNTYDYDTSLANGTYLLNGALPEFAQIGNYIELSGAWFLIEEIIYDENINSDVIVISSIYTDPDVSVIVGCIFNRFNYEVYEFTIDMVDYIDQYFSVRINNSDSNFTELIHLSEQIWCKVKHNEVLDIRFKNSTNTDMMYSTGIENIILARYTYIKGKVNEENETHKTDTTAILLNSELYEVDEIVFEPVTKEIWRKLMIALSHEIVTINGVGYIKNGDFNTEGPLEDSNLYVLTANMIKTGSVYNSQNASSLGFNGSEVEVPGLISTDSGYVSY